MKFFVHLSILLAFQFFGFSSSTSAQLIVAHRGASADAPENTIKSFQVAWEQGADAVEADFYLTSDHKIVCFHDSTTERICGVNLPVAQSTLAQLQELDVGSWKDKRFAGQRMPGLPDVLDSIPADKSLFIEVKSGPDIVPVLQRTLNESCASPERTFIISFNEHVIRATKKEMPQYKAYWLVGFQKDERSGKWTPTVEDLITTAKEINADGVDLNANAKIVDARFVDCCQQAGLSVHAWTVDDLAKAIELKKMDIDSITTNRPGFLRSALAQYLESQPQTSELSPVGIVNPDTLPVAVRE